MKKIHNVLVITAMCFAWCFAQHANDSLLFVIKLDEDTTGLFGCRWGEPVRNSLSGPVLMQGHTLLFYSRDGYVLYDQRGHVTDEHSLIRKNRSLARKGQPLVRLAYPIDNSTLVYYTEPLAAGQQKQVLYKRLYSRALKSVNGDAAFQSNEQVGSAQLFNLYHNSITDEMATKTTLTPHLVGYSSLADGMKWWALDKFYSFTSPLILEEKGAYRGFFPGFRDVEGMNVKRTLIEPLGVFFMNGMWYYYGAYSPGGASQEQCFQRLFLCDQAGNLLYDNTILKMTVVDDVLGESEEEKMIYTVKRAARHVFLPAVDENGDIFYGIIDYRKRQIEVMKRIFYKFCAVPCGPALEDIIFRQQGYEYDVSGVQCGESGREEAVIPRIHFAEPGNELIEMGAKELTTKGYLVKIARRKDDALAKTISRVHGTLPQRIQAIQDSLSRLSTASCPYSLVLTQGKKKELCRFNYGLGDVVLCARILCVTNTFEVFVRVDLVDRAEVVVFSTEGQYMNRFRFNSENHEVRNDIVAVSEDRRIIEKDYEIGEGAYQYLEWKLVPACY